MCKLKFGTIINFAKIVNSSFTRSELMHEKTKKALEKPDLPIHIKNDILATFAENRLLTGIESLYGSLGRFDLMESNCEFNPVNVRYECDPRKHGAMMRELNRLDIDSANFLLSYIQWRTGEVITDCDWNVTQVWSGLMNIHKADDFLEAITV